MNSRPSCEMSPTSDHDRLKPDLDFAWYCLRSRASVDVGPEKHVADALLLQLRAKPQTSDEVNFKLELSVTTIGTLPHHRTSSTLLLSQCLACSARSSRRKSVRISRGIETISVADSLLRQPRQCGLSTPQVRPLRALSIISASLSGSSGLAANVWPSRQASSSHTASIPSRPS